MAFRRRIALTTVSCLSSLANPAAGQQVPAAPIASYADGMLVTSNDITTCPYTMLGAVSVNMRARSYSPKELEAGAITEKLRAKARKMAADAVVLVTVGESHMMLTSLRSTPVTGRAIKYVDASCAPSS